MKRPATILLTGQDVRELLSLDECIAAVEAAFRLQGEGRTMPPGILGFHLPNGGFHVKAGVLELKRTYFAAKINGNFAGNGGRFGLPTIQGVLVLGDGENGCPLAVMDSTVITAQRTAGATAVAAKYLARKDSRVVAIIGCGVQAGFQLQALSRVLGLEKVWAFDQNSEKARQFAEQFSFDLGIQVAAAAECNTATRQSDVCVTCTTSRDYFLTREDVKLGTFIAAIGADNPEKQELDPALMAASKIVTDITGQCAAIGDLHHALEAGAVTAAEVHGELGEVVAGKKNGRSAEEEIVIFDSTGVALQDVAAAAIVYEKAASTGSGFSLNFAA
jgi:alanine dehydrogenase